MPGRDGPEDGSAVAAPAGPATSSELFSAGFWFTLVREISLPTAVLAVVACLGTSRGLLVIFVDPSPVWWVYPMLFAPFVTGLWLALEQLWRPSVLPPLTRYGLRQLLIGPVLVGANAVAHLVVGWQAAAVAAAEARSDEPATAAGQLLSAVGFLALGGFVASLLGGLAGLLLALLPVWALRHDDVFARANAWSTAPADRTANRLAAKLLVLVLLLAFVLPTLFVVGEQTAVADSLPEALGNAGRAFGDARYLGDLAWVLGPALAPLCLVLAFAVRRLQRVEAGSTPTSRNAWWGR